MKKVGIILFLLVGVGNAGFSQSYFNKLYKSPVLANGIVEVANGYIMTNEQAVSLVYELSLIKLNYKGDTLSKKIIGSAPASIIAGFGIKSRDGNAVFNGYIQDTVAQTYQSKRDIILIKVNAQTGDTIWMKRYRAKGEDISQYVIQTKDGGFAIVGSTDSYGAPGSADYYLIKTDSLGNMQWYKTFGGSNDDEAYSIANTTEGGFILGGYSNSFNTNYDVYIVKTDSLGNKEWEKTYDTDDDNGGAVTALSNNQYLIAHSYKETATGHTFSKLIRIKVDGSIIWQKTYKYSNYLAFCVPSIENNDGTITTGAIRINSGTAEMGYLLKVSSIGDTIWSRIYTPRNDLSTYIYVLKRTSDGGFVFVGSGFDSGSKQRAWAVKLDCMGNDSIHYAKQNGCCGLYTAQVSSNTSKEIFCKGDSITLAINPAYTSYAWSNGSTQQSIKVKQTGTYTVTISNANSCTLAILPTIVTAETFPIPAISKIGNVLSSNYTTGNHWYKDGQPIAEATAQTDTARIGGSYTVVVSNTCGVGTSQAKVVTGITEVSINSEQITVWPNPVVGGELRIQSAEKMDVIELYNMLGQQVLQTKYSESIDVSGFSKGVYTVKINTREASIVRKIAIQ